MRRPVSALVLTNLASGTIGLLQGLAVLSWLGAAQYGVVAVIVACSAVAANLIDVRLADLTMRLCGESAVKADVATVIRRTAMVQTGLLLQTILAAVIFLLASALTFVLLPHVVEASVPPAVVFSIAAAQAMTYLGSLLGYVPRLTGRLDLLIICQLVNGVLGASIALYIVWSEPTVLGYSLALLLSALASLVSAAVVALYVWRKVCRRSLCVPLERRFIKEYLGHWKFFLSSSVLGMTKLLHRAADVLVVGYFCGDRETGLYKFARSSTDLLYIWFDAGNKVYQPRLWSLLAQGRIADYRKAASAIAMRALLLLTPVIVCELVFLPDVLRLTVGSEFVAAAPSIVALTFPTLFAVGIHLWAWPLLVFHGYTRRYAFTNLTAVLCGQYAFGIVLFLVGNNDPTSFAIGYAASYAILCLLLARAIVRRRKLSVLVWLPRFDNESMKNIINRRRVSWSDVRTTWSKLALTMRFSNPD